jgi:hypothetical protein
MQRILALGALLLSTPACSATPDAERWADNSGDVPGADPGAGAQNLYLTDSETDCGSAGGVSCKRNQYGITFGNDDGEWVIYTDCYGPKKRGGENVAVGPGYIARVTLQRTPPDGNRTIIDDEQGPGKHNGVLNAPGFGGLGAFGWHHSRGKGSYDFGDDNAWNLDGRHCAEDNGNFGVSGAQVVEGPSVSEDGVGALSVDVFFTDGWTQGAPLMSVRYRYRFHHDVVKMWAAATQHCDKGMCGSDTPGPAYIKEPKFVAGVTGGGYKRLLILNDESQVATNSVSTTKYCAWRGTDPVKSTGQCDADRRARARFDFRDALPTSAADNGGDCDTGSHPCFNVVMRGYQTPTNGDVSIGGSTSAWEGSGVGLDAWALSAAARSAVNVADSPAGNAQWSCHGGDPDLQQQRRWELAGGPKNGSGEYQAASVFFHAWEGGTGAYDCEPLSRRFGPEGESFAIHAEYAVNTGWQLE